MAADRDAQILALWRGRPSDQRALEDVVAFHEWLVAYAPWLLRPGGSSLDHVRALVEAHTISPDELRDSGTKARRQRAPKRNRRGEG
jgi:hypothetical protein